MTDAKQLAANFDHTDPAQMNSPQAMYAALRAQCPVGRSEKHGGFFVAARYSEAKRVFEDYQNFSSSTGVGIPPHPYQMLPIDLDPPQQTAYRRILNKPFNPENIARKRGEIEAEVNRLIDDFIERGTADLATELVRPLLPAIVLPFLGVPIEDREQMSDWIEYLTRGRATDMPGVIATGEKIGGYLMGLAARRRAQPRDEDIISVLLDAQVDGAPLSDEQIFRTLFIILFGGLDTTSSVMLEALMFLSGNPDEKQRLARGERDWVMAIEEFVRYTSPVQGLRRTVVKDAQLDAQALKTGDWVFALIGSANRDEAVFPDADRCLLDRKPNPHIGFSAGAHTCLGRHLARLEIEVLLGIVLARLPDYRVVEGFTPDYLVGEARGMKSLPVRFTPGKKR